MLDFAAVRDGSQTFDDLARDLRPDALHDLTDEMIDLVLNITAPATDADLQFEPVDAQAPTNEDGTVARGWTLAHVVTHMTAGSEETAAIAATLARGVLVEGRSRYEVPWDTIQTVVQLRERIEESRRMRHALLNAWPDQPHLELRFKLAQRFDPLNAPACFILGLFHEDGHLEQLREVMRQALAARRA